MNLSNPFTESNRQNRPIQPQLSIIVISYNTCELTLACLGSVFEETHLDRGFEVIVVDNDSSDGSAEAIARQFPQVHLIRAGENHGFAKANNIAAEVAKADYLLLLNPDTVILNRAVDKFIEFALTDGGDGIYGGRTLFADHSLNPQSCWKTPSLWSLFCTVSGLSKLIPNSDWFNPDYMPQWERDSVRDVDIVSGCFFLISRENWERLGGFDSAFHMYGEEFDLCLRAKKLGIQCKVTPDAEIIHYGGASEKVRADKMCRLFETKAKLFTKHWPPPQAWVGCQLLKLWALTRLFAFTLIDQLQCRKDQIDTWLTIWRRRHQWLPRRGQ